MILLPSEQKERIKEAIEQFSKTSELSIFEPCDCGNQVRHNNGGNYHQEIYLKHDSGQTFVKYETSCNLVAPAQWQECKNVNEIIKCNADWL